LSTGQLELSSSCLFLNQVLYVATLHLPSRDSKPSLTTAKSKWRPCPATAWLERVAAQGWRQTFDTSLSDQVRPRDDFSIVIPS
jgi:hypothetical protein